VSNTDIIAAMSNLTAEDKLVRVFRSLDKGQSGTIEFTDFMETMAVLDRQLFTKERLEGMLQVSDSRKNGNVNYGEFVEWLFGRQQQKMAMSKGTALLLDQLLAVEGNPSAEEHLLAQIQSLGCCMIVTVNLVGPNDIDILEMFKYLRALFALRVWNSDIRLVKSDGPRFFTYGTTPAKALVAAMKIRILVNNFAAWLASVSTSEVPLEDVSVSIGIKDGSLVLIEGDVYGDPVNVASKLGEDIAEPGELLVAQTCVEQNDPEMQQMLKGIDQEERSMEISGITLHYFCMKERDSTVQNIVSSLSMPTPEETEAHLEVTVMHSHVEQTECVILVTDLSGFTRLTKQYGILHFLRLVLKCRSVIVPLVIQYGGHKIKYEGDNVIARFPNSDAAMCAIAEAWKELMEYNHSRTKDFKIRAGCCLGYGEVAISGHDITGPGFEQTFHLAEDVAGVGEILITPNMRQMGWPSMPYEYEVSEEKDVEGKDYTCCSVEILHDEKHHRQSMGYTKTQLYQKPEPLDDNEQEKRVVGQSSAVRFQSQVSQIRQPSTMTSQLSQKTAPQVSASPQMSSMPSVAPQMSAAFSTIKSMTLQR
jgi:class 3 adenylate cyclase